MNRFLTGRRHFWTPWSERTRCMQNRQSVFFLSPHTPVGRVRLLRHTLPISLLILRKKPTVLQSSSTFSEWKKRLIHEEANIFIILLSWSSLKREHVLFSMRASYHDMWHEELCFCTSMICSDIWHKYHEWYFKIVIRNFKFETILKYHEWYLCQISRTNHAIICLYYYLQKVCNFHM